MFSYVVEIRNNALAPAVHIICNKIEKKNKTMQKSKRTKETHSKVGRFAHDICQDLSYEGQVSKEKVELIHVQLFFEILISHQDST